MTRHISDYLLPASDGPAMSVLESNSFPWVFLLFLESSFKNSSVCSSKALRCHASRGWKLTPPRFLDQLDHGMG